MNKGYLLIAGLLLGCDTERGGREGGGVYGGRV